MEEKEKGEEEEEGEGSGTEMRAKTTGGSVWMERRRGPKEAPVGFSSLRHCGRSSGFRSFLFISFSLIKTNFAYGLRICFFSIFVYQFHFSVEFANWRTESDTKWRTKTRALNPFHNIPQKRRNNQKRRKKIKSFPKRKEQQKKQKVRGKHCPKNLPDVLSLTLLFFCNFIYPHPGRWKGSVVYQGGFELQVSPPSPGRRHHVARQAGEERGSGGRHFLLWRAGVEVLQARWFGFLWFVFNFVCLFLFLWLY